MRLILILVAALVALTGCGKSDDQQLVLTGSSTVAPIMSEIAKAYEKAHPGVRIDVQTGGSSRGVGDARKGLADIGMASRALKDSETDLIAHTVALDGIGVILHTDNPISELSDAQIVSIYRGEITNWNEVGGVDAPITVVNKSEGRSTLELFLSYFKLENSEIKAQVIIGDNPQGIKTVVGNPNAIGYVSIGAAEYEANQGAPLKLLPMNGVPASIDNVRNGSFPLSRPLNLLTTEEPAGLVKDLIDFALSKDANDIIESQYFVPVARG